MIPQLLKRSVILFPRRPYLLESAVRHNRRAWAECQLKLAERGLQTYPGLRIQSNH